MSVPEIKGWCPGALRPMLSGDGLVVRVRPHGGRLTRDQAQRIATLAASHGNGIIELSSRANIQMRGVSDASHGPLIDGLSKLGLIDPTTEIEARRNIVVTPFWQEGDGTSDLVAALAEELARSDAPDLPGKFGFAVDTGHLPVLRGVSADIRIERAQDGLVVFADSCALGASANWTNAAEMAVSLAHWFLETGGSVDGRGRMAAHLAKKERLPDAFLVRPIQVLPVTPIPTPGRVDAGYLVGFEFGQLQAKSLSILAESGPMRLTPWRMLLIEGAVGAPDITGLITDPGDSRLRVSACTGTPGCPQALGQTRTIARALATSVPIGSHLHVSGCPKGCAHPAPSTSTLVARRDGLYDLIRDGRAADSPILAGLMPEALVATPEILTEVHNAP